MNKNTEFFFFLPGTGFKFYFFLGRGRGMPKKRQLVIFDKKIIFGGYNKHERNERIFFFIFLFEIFKNKK